MQESRTYWFNAASIETDEEFMLIGLVLGLAIYNAVLLDFPLPQALYRKLLGQACTLRDLSDMDPTLGRSLGLLLAYDGEAFHCHYLFLSGFCSLMESRFMQMPANSEISPLAKIIDFTVLPLLSMMQQELPFAYRRQARGTGLLPEFHCVATRHR